MTRSRSGQRDRPPSRRSAAWAGFAAPISVVVAAGPVGWAELARRCLETTSDVRLVAAASDSEQAVAVVRLHRPAVVLVDREVPRAGMLAAVPGLRQANPSVRLLAVTGHPDDSFALQVIRRGGHGVIAEEAFARHLAKAVRCLAAGQAWLTRAQEAQVLGALWEMAGPGSV